MNINESTPLEVAKSIFRAGVGDVQAIEELPGHKNLVFKVTAAQTGEAFVVKLFAPSNELVGINELLLYDHLQGTPFVRRRIAAARATTENPSSLILEYLEGATLLEKIAEIADDPQRLRSVTEQIIEYIAHCCTIRTERFGGLDAELKGTHHSWSGFLEDYLERAAER